jgi:hypothetical protein
MDNIITDLPKTSVVDFVDALPNFQPADMELGSDYQLGDSRPATPPVVLEEGSSMQELDSDFDRVRTNLANLAEKSSEVVEDLLSLARSTESPRAYEVLTTAISTLLSANKDLLEAHAKKADIRNKLSAKETPTTQVNTQNNTVFVGSSEDLLDMLTRK